jgi:hypothetical protein
MKGMACLLAIVAFAGWSQVPKADPLKTTGRFLASMGLRRPASPPIAKRISSPAGDRWSVDYGRDYQMTVSADGTSVNAFYNWARQRDISERHGRTGHRRFATAAAAKRYAIGLAKKLGVPASAPMIEFKYGTPNGEISARWADTPNGYPFLKGGNGARILLDMQDGALKLYGGAWRTKVASPVISISMAKAISIGDAYAETHRLYWQTGRTHGRLGWIDPRPNALGSKAVLVYRVSRGRDVVYVDAATGAIQGSERFK